MTEAAQQGQGIPAPEGTQMQGEGQQQGQAERTFTQADLKKIAANEKREGKQSAIKELLEQTGAESLDDVLSAWTEYQGIQEAVTSETDRLSTDLEKAKGQLKAEREARATDKKTYALEGALRDTGINPERLRSAMRLADLSAIDVDKEGNVSGIESVVEAVQEEAPEWFGASAEGRSRVNAPQTAGTTVDRPSGQTPEEIQANWLMGFLGNG